MTLRGLKKPIGYVACSEIMYPSDPLAYAISTLNDPKLQFPLRTIHPSELHGHGSMFQESWQLLGNSRLAIIRPDSREPKSFLLADLAPYIEAGIAEARGVPRVFVFRPGEQRSFLEQSQQAIVTDDCTTVRVRLAQFALQCLSLPEAQQLVSASGGFVFISSRFDDNNARNRVAVVSEALESAGGQASFEEHDCTPGFADARLRTRIQNCDFAVIDWSDPSPNIAYEFGLALGIGKRAYLIRQTGAGSAIPRLLGDYRCVDFGSLGELRARLNAALSTWVVPRESAELVSPGDASRAGVAS